MLDARAPMGAHHAATRDAIVAMLRLGCASLSAKLARGVSHEEVYLAAYTGEAAGGPQDREAREGREREEGSAQDRLVHGVVSDGLHEARPGDWPGLRYVAGDACDR
jgi:hypothetical protein